MEADPDIQGRTVAGVLRDGDWNIAQKWLVTTACAPIPMRKRGTRCSELGRRQRLHRCRRKIHSRYSEVRPVVRNGKRTGETKKVTVNGVVTWTPGDVTIAQKKGGLISIISTKEYSSQMPCVVIGIDKWMKQNRATVRT
jgi:hypothetical protein